MERHRELNDLIGQLLAERATRDERTALLAARIRRWMHLLNDDLDQLVTIIVGVDRMGRDAA